MIRKFVKGKTPKQHIDSIDHVLQSFSRRLATRAIALTMPVPVMFCVRTPTGDGVIGQYVSFESKIGEVYVYLGKMKKESVSISLSTLTDLAQSGMRINVNAKQTRYDVNWDIEAGSLVCVKLDDPSSAEDIYVTLMTYPHVSLVDKEKLMLDKILQLEDKENEDERVSSESDEESS